MCASAATLSDTPLLIEPDERHGHGHPPEIASPLRYDYDATIPRVVGLCSQGAKPQIQST